MCQQLKPEDALKFSFRRVENLFAERAPLTFRLVSNLCGVRDGEHAGQQTYLSSVCTNADSFDSADELADVEEAWDEGNSWRDDSQFFFVADNSEVLVPPSSSSAAGSSSRKGRQTIH